MKKKKKDTKTNPMPTQRKVKNEGKVWDSTISETNKKHIYHSEGTNTYNPEAPRCHDRRKCNC